MKALYNTILMIPLILLTFLACSRVNDSTIDTPQSEDSQRIVPTVDGTDNPIIPFGETPSTKSFVNGGNAFAFKLLKEIAEKEDGTFMISPLGVSLAFGMLIEAAKEGEELKEVRKLLGFENGSREEIRKYCSTMIEMLPKMDKLSNLSIANMALVNSDMGPVNSNYSNTASGHYDALVKNMSFSSPKLVAGFVNDWVKEKTYGMIQKAMDEGDITPKSTAILTNTLYFDGKWTSLFKESDTEKEEFYLEDGRTKEIDMMKQETKFSFRWFYNDKSPVGGVLRMPYGNGSFAMDVYLLHDENDSVGDLLKTMAENKSQQEEWQAIKTDLWFPRFELGEKRIELNKVLADMGLERALSSDDWLSFFKNENQKSGIDKVYQTTAMKVNESGTEASAVTIVTMEGSAFGYNAQEQKLTFHCDHPFIYTITETSTGAILFAGVFRGE